MGRNSRGTTIIEALVASVIFAVLILFVFSALTFFYNLSYKNNNVSNMNILATQNIEKMKSLGYAMAPEGRSDFFCDRSGKPVALDQAEYKVSINIVSSSLEYKPDGTVSPGNNSTRMVIISVSDLTSNEVLEQSTMLVKGGI